MRDLAALGIDWDGEPVRQSERGAAYGEALAELERDGAVYPCFCTRADIRAATAAPHGEEGAGTAIGAYPGTCRELTAAERRERESAGRPPALRVRSDVGSLAFHDRLHGACEAAVDDFVVRRNDGAYGYQLTVVVDDDIDGVGEVVRGDDLLESTARQIWLARRLGIEPPAHAHVPLILGPDGERLTKRHGAITLADRAAAGEGPDEVRRTLLRSAGQANDVGEPLAAVAARFDPATVPACATILEEV